MRDEGVDGAGALLPQQLGSARDRVRRVYEVIDKDTDPTLDVAYEHHSRVLAIRNPRRPPFLDDWVSLNDALETQITSPYLVDEGKLHAQAIGDRSGSLGTACIRTDNHGILKVRNVLLNIPLQQWPAIQVVHWYVEEPLVLGIMKV